MLNTIKSVFILASLASQALSFPALHSKRIANDAVPRNVVYVQTFTNPDGSQLSLLPLLEQSTGVTHVLLAALHINDDPNAVTLNDDPPSSSKYDFLWPEVQTLQQNGIKVMMMLGGAAQGSYQKLASNFQSYYPPLLQVLKDHNIDGLDLDIEENVDINGPLQLLRQLNADMGSDFILTSAPEASGLITGGSSLTSFSYFDLDNQATESSRPNGKLINWFNAQAYNGWGDTSSTNTYDSIVSSGFAASRVVLGVLDNSGDGGSGFNSLNTLNGVIGQLRSSHGDFGGVFGWEYFNAGGSDGDANPWDWVKQIGSDLTAASAARSLTHIGTPAKPGSYASPVTPFELQMSKLTSEGYTFGESLVALNRTRGVLDDAKLLLETGPRFVHGGQ